MEEVQIALQNIFNTEFELIHTGYNTGKFNMDYDLELTHKVAQGYSRPIFRLYGWDPWAVSLGANQKLSDIDLDKCNELGWSVVFRPTGGRAVLHANEITYSVITRLSAGQTSHSVYRDIHIILLKAFEKIGCKGLEFHKAQPDFREFYKKEDISVSCFASTARYEIAFEGRKVVGSAQRLYGDTLLQHGSIPLYYGYEQIADVLNSKDPEKKIKLKEFLLKHSATISESAGRIVNYNEALKAITGIITENYFVKDNENKYSKKIINLT